MKLTLTILILLAAVTVHADSVRSGKGVKYHARGTNNMTLCWRPASAGSHTNTVDCKQCQWAAK